MFNLTRIRRYFGTYLIAEAALKHFIISCIDQPEIPRCIQKQRQQSRGNSLKFHQSYTKLCDIECRLDNETQCCQRFCIGYLSNSTLNQTVAIIFKLLATKGGRLEV